MVTKILIVDDHQDYRATIKHHLSKQNLGLEIFEASTGEMAVTKAACIKPAIVLMDINLPDANGITAAKHIKEDHPDCDVIILTMFEVKPFKEIARKIKVKDFIGKSEIYEKLVPAIKKCLKHKKKKGGK